MYRPPPFLKKRGSRYKLLTNYYANNRGTKAIVFLSVCKKNYYNIYMTHLFKRENTGETPEVFDERIDLEDESLLEEKDILLEEDESILEEDEQTEEEGYLMSISVDTEFTDTEPLSLQAYVESKQFSFKFIVINSKYKSYIPSGIIGTFVYYSSFDPNEAVLMVFLIQSLKDQNLFDNLFINNRVKCTIELFFYYSLKDLTYSFGLTIMYPYYKGTSKKGRLIQRRNVSGFLVVEYPIDYNLFTFVFVLKDLVSLHPGGLAELANSVGLKKIDALDQYKKDMSIPLKEKPLEFIEYGLNDAVLLPQIYRLKQDSFNEILKLYNVPEKYYFKRKTFPLTIGTIVHSVWGKNIIVNVFLNNDAIRLALLKQGILNQMHPNYKQSLECFKLLSKQSNLSQLEMLQLSKPKEFEFLFETLSRPKVFSYKVTQYASVNYLLSESKTYNGIFLGMTTGGRTVNERPTERLIPFGADIDIQSAYGSQLRKLIYPIGRPRIIEFSSNEFKSITLAKFMNKFKNILKPNMYKIVVSGTLNFQQDLIFSKIAPQFKSDLKIQYDKIDPESPAVNVPFVLLRNEIKHGFITSRVWEIIQKVSTTSEFSDFCNLKVESAIYWASDQEVSTIQELADCVLKDKGTYKFSNKLNTIVDNRTYKWYGYSLEAFIGPLIERRKILKKQKDVISKALEQAIKLVVNTTWGLLTSPYFEINNVVCSEIVTSNIRVSVWLMNKGLNTFLSITDGGPYSLMHVTFFKKNISLKKPGIETLSDYNIYKDHRSLEIKPLENIDWQEHFKKNLSPASSPFTDLDKYAQEHLILFWKHYDIQVDFQVEHKMENTFVKGAYILKAHYAFLTYNCNTKAYDLVKYKIRGFHEESDLEYQNPIYYLILQILLDSDKDFFVIRNNGFYNQKKLIKLNSWRRSLVKNSNNRTISSFGANVLPGDSVLLQSQFRLNNNHFFLLNEKTYKKRLRRGYQNIEIFLKGIKTKVRALLFEKYLNYFGINSTYQYMERDDLRQGITLIKDFQYTKIYKASNDSEYKFYNQEFIEERDKALENETKNSNVIDIDLNIQSDDESLEI